MQTRITQLTEEKRKLLAQHKRELLPTINEVNRQLNQDRDGLR